MTPPPQTPAPPDDGSDVSAELVVAGLAVLQQARDLEGRLQRRLARRAADVRRDVVRDSLEAAEQVQGVRAEAVRQIARVVRALDAQARAQADEAQIAREMTEHAAGQPPPGGGPPPPPPFLAHAQTGPVLRCDSCHVAPPPDVVVHDNLMPGDKCPSCPQGKLFLGDGGTDDRRSD